MQGVEIFLLVFFVLLIIVGVILTIYFVWKNENDKKKQSNGGSTGPNGGSTGPNGGSTGPNGGSILVPGIFSISPESNPNVYMTSNTISPNDVKVIASSDSSVKCENYSWKNISNSEFKSALLSNSTDIGSFISPVNLDTGGLSGEGLGLQVILDNRNTKNSTGNNWVYDNTEKRWCDLLSSTSCLFYNSNGLVTLEDYTTRRFLNSDKFRWDNVPAITSPKCSA